MLAVSRVLRSCPARCLASLTTAPACDQHTLPDLPYKYNALEPFISAEIMHLHHEKHHATYVNNLNAAEQQLKEALAAGDTSRMVKLQPAIRFNGGGHINHSIFWEVMSPNGGNVPKGDLHDALYRDFGSFDGFIKEMSAATIAIQGSGWGWLGYKPINDRLKIITCANQDPLEATTGLVPLLGIDIWEHAYYLQYRNVRVDYVKAIWNVINWENVAERFQTARES